MANLKRYREMLSFSIRDGATLTGEQCAELLDLLPGDVPRDEWIALKDRQPEHDMMCFVTDGREVALMNSDCSEWTRGEVWWDGGGITGRDWELRFTPTHWKPLTISLPSNSAGTA